MRRGRPVVAPNSLPTLRSRSPVSSVQLGRVRAPADAGRVGLGDAEHVVDRPRAEATADHRVAGHRVGAGDERVGAVVDVEHRALGALEEELLGRPSRPGRARARRRWRSVARRCPSAGVLLDDGRLVEVGRLAPSRASSSRACAQPLLHLAARAAPRRAGRAPAGRAAPPCPRRSGRCRGRWCRSSPAPAASSRATSICLCHGMMTWASSETSSWASSLRKPLLLEPRRSPSRRPPGRAPPRCR